MEIELVVLEKSKNILKRMFCYEREGMFLKINGRVYYSMFKIIDMFSINDLKEINKFINKNKDNLSFDIYSSFNLHIGYDITHLDRWNTNLGNKVSSKQKSTQEVKDE